MRQVDPADGLPAVIPEKLRRRGRSLPPPDDGVVVWDRTTALAVLDSLRGSKVAIGAGCVNSAATPEPVPLDDWAAPLCTASTPRPTPNEPAPWPRQRSGSTPMRRPARCSLPSTSIPKTALRKQQR